MKKLQKGTFYGVSVGPGDPELMTLKAVRVLENTHVIATPQTTGKNTLAYDIATQAVDLSKKEMLIFPFLMARDYDKMQENHKETARIIKQRLDNGEDVAMLNLGDVSVYSSFSYIMDILMAEGYEVQMIPGVTSFCAVASRLQMSLTTMNKPLHIIPAASMDDEQALALSGTKVIMKSGTSLDSVRSLLVEKGVADQAKLVQNCGLPNENVAHDIMKAPADISYFTTIVIKEK